jgi:ABC-2 type transport system permease protein
MSTAVLDSTDGRADRAATRPSLARLAAVELRKMVDTRAGFWLLVSMALLMLTLVIVTGVTGAAQDRTLQGFVAAALFPAALLVSVVGILLVTSEWSQRTAMITFALVPDRERVLAAKIVAGVVLALATFALVLAMGVATMPFAGSGIDDAWSLPTAMIGQEAVLVATTVIMGIAFGAMLLNTPAAIVLYFSLPIGFQVLGAIPRLDGPAGWLDGGRSTAPMTEHVMSATEWARAGTTIAVWVGVPLLVGLWRIRRDEVR